MLTVRVEDIGCRVGYVVSDELGDMEVFDSRQDADLFILGMSMPREDVVEQAVEMALEYAKSKHGDQEHGCYTIGKHLEIVTTLVGVYCEYPKDSLERMEVMCAAALHDIVEDTTVTVDEILNDFNDGVAGLVDVLTDRPGLNRYERHLNTYWRIRERGSDAVLIKLCDRLANQARSIKHGDEYLKMYSDEYLYFKMALWRPDEHVKIWKLLDSQAKLMKDRINGAGLQEGSGLPQDARTGGEEQAAQKGPLLGGEGRQGF